MATPSTRPCCGRSQRDGSSPGQVACAAQEAGLIGRLAVVLVAVAVACSSQPSSGSVRGELTAASEKSVTIRSPRGVEAFVNESDVPLEHLQEHVREEWPVVVKWRLRSGRKVAELIEDAPS